MIKELPTMMTVQDVADYRGIPVADAVVLVKQYRVVGTYYPSKGRAAALYDAADVADKCRRGHLLPAPKATCKTCKFLTAIGREETHG